MYAKLEALSTCLRVFLGKALIRLTYVCDGDIIASQTAVKSLQCPLDIRIAWPPAVLQGFSHTSRLLAAAVKATIEGNRRTGVSRAGRELMVACSIGHSNLDAEEVVKPLEQCGTEMILDVHTCPHSPFSASSIS